MSTQKSSELGMNRTGVGTSPIGAKETAEGAAEGGASPGDVRDLLSARDAYLAAAEPLGHVPPPPTVKGMAKTAMQAIAGKRPTVLMDLLSQRLAFERTGTRLYQAVIAKVAAQEGHGLPLADIERIHDEELAHFQLVHDAIVSLGGDPTVVSPAADVASVVSSGILSVVLDPRTTIAESLDAVLSAELTDNAGWELLIDVARKSGQDEMAERFEPALAAEMRHVGDVRSWLRCLVEKAAGVDEPAEKSA